MGVFRKYRLKMINFFKSSNSCPKTGIRITIDIRLLQEARKNNYL